MEKISETQRFAVPKHTCEIVNLTLTIKPIYNLIQVEISRTCTAYNIIRHIRSNVIAADVYLAMMLLIEASVRVKVISCLLTLYPDNNIRSNITTKRKSHSKICVWPDAINIV